MSLPKEIYSMDAQSRGHSETKHRLQEGGVHVSNMPPQPLHESSSIFYSGERPMERRDCKPLFSLSKLPCTLTLGHSTAVRCESQIWEKFVRLALHVASVALSRQPGVPCPRMSASSWVKKRVTLRGNWLL